MFWGNVVVLGVVEIILEFVMEVEGICKFFKIYLS